MPNMRDAAHDEKHDESDSRRESGVIIILRRLANTADTRLFDDALR